MRDVEEQLSAYWQGVTEDVPVPAANQVMEAGAAEWGVKVTNNGNGQVVTPLPPPVEPEGPRRPSWVLAVAAVVVGFVTLSGAYVLTRPAALQSTDDVIVEEPSEDATPQDVSAIIVPQDALDPIQPGRTAATGGTPLPDIAGAIPGDDGSGPVPLGVVNELPRDVYLDFLFEVCDQPGCFRDAVFMDAAEPGVLVEAYGGVPFHVRHGFVNDGSEPLGDGFDVVLYVFPMDDPGESEGIGVGPTTRYTSDFVMRGEADQCGPTYTSQAGPVQCEWFVHDFPVGLSGDRFALWAVWEAPCSAWLDMGFTSTCADPSEVMSFFSSGVDSPFGVEGLQFGAGEFEGREEEAASLTVPIVGRDLTMDASGSAATGGTPLPDFDAVVLGDDGSAPQPLGVVDASPGPVYLDFLSELCDGDTCFRDAVFKSDTDTGLESGPSEAGEPFHVRHGFVNNAAEPLGDGFDVALYVFPMDAPGEMEGATIGTTTRYTSDYVMRGEASQCGPTYRSQSGPVQCEWFVHDFPDGLPDGRFALWAFWEAPCSAWVEMGFTSTCANPDEVLSLFSSGVDSPFGGESGQGESGQGDSGHGEPYLNLSPPDVEADASGSAPTGGTPLPDIAGAVLGDDGAAPSPLGSTTSPPGEDRLDFLFEFCGGSPCFRDAHFMDPSDPTVGSGPYEAGRPFHIRHGFVNESAAPLGPGFDVAVYVFAFDGLEAETTRYTSDYVLRGETERCGPTYNSQSGPVTCEWFVHDFPDGLPEGRFALWAFWEAPCSAWVDMGFANTCANPNEVLSLFSSGFDSPFGDFQVEYHEIDGSS